MGAGDQEGTVAKSRHFQFTLAQTTSRTGLRSSPWQPNCPGTRTKVTNRWIYAIQLGEKDGDQSPILFAEYKIDKDGKIGFVPGAKRRKIDAKEKGAPYPVSIPDVALPIGTQTRHYRYRFIATRGRLTASGIACLEGNLDGIYHKKDLTEDRWFHDVEGVTYVDAVDPLDLAEWLNARYKAALTEKKRYTVPDPDDASPTNAVMVRTRQYQLARTLKDSLIEPGGWRTDNMKLDGYFQGGNDAVVKHVKDYEDTIEGLHARCSNAAIDLRDYLNSEIMRSARDWYQKTEFALTEIGHYWLDTAYRCLEGMCETPEGRDFLRALVRDENDGLLSFLIQPEEGSPGDAVFGLGFPVTRKTITAGVIAFAETAPAVMLYSKSKNAHLRIQLTMQNFFLSTEIKLKKRAPRTLFAHTVKKGANFTLATHVEVDYKNARIDWEQLVENGKPHWPDGTHHAEWSEVFGRVLAAVEVINLASTFRASIEKATAQDADTDKQLTALAETIGGCLDLAVALEDPIHAYAKHLDSVLYKGAAKGHAAAEVGVHGAAEGEHVAASAAAHGAEHGAEEEFEGIFTKLTKPAMFKALGAISAMIDMVCYYREGNEALEKNETGLAAGYYTVAGGSAVIAFASIMNAAGYLWLGVGVTAAASVLMVVGVIIVVVGFAIVAFFTTSAWQRFADRSVFGLNPAHEGHASWSGGNFNKWNGKTVPGLDRQLLVLSAMLCSFEVSGDQGDYQTIHIDFGSIPPGAKMYVDFTITYDTWPKEYKPTFVLDLDHDTWQYGGDAVGAYKCDFIRSKEKRLTLVHLQPLRPAGMTSGKITMAFAEIVIRYAGSSVGASDKPDTGVIPIIGKMKYELFEDGINYHEGIKSLDYEPKKKKGEHGEGEQGEHGKAEAPEHPAAAKPEPAPAKPEPPAPEDDPSAHAIIL